MFYIRMYTMIDFEFELTFNADKLIKKTYTVWHIQRVISPTEHLAMRRVFLFK